jgi:glycopeptide antibiotics resistance protein
MYEYKKRNRSYRPVLNSYLRRNSPVSVILSFMIILVATQFPFDFSFEENISILTIIKSFQYSGSFFDWLVNIVLFIPFGISLIYLFKYLSLNQFVGFSITLLACISLSSIVEVLQFYLPNRYPTFADIVANSLGGCISFCLIKTKVIKRFMTILSFKNTLVISSIYCVLAFFLSVALLKTTNFSNWDTSYPLIIGNEKTEDRPWHGYISELVIADHDFSTSTIKDLLLNRSTEVVLKKSLVAFYDFDDNDKYVDRTGTLVPLAWQGGPSVSQESSGVLVTSQHWLESVSPPTLLVDKLKETSQLMLSFKVATIETTQTGPARIISLSENPYSRNFTIGQQENNLVFRLRTPITGKNGQRPEFIVPNVFLDTNFHRLIITYRGSTVRFYVDSAEHLFEFSFHPSIIIFQFLSPHDMSLEVNAFNIQAYDLLYYFLLFSPFGLLLSLIGKTFDKWTTYLVFGTISASISASILEYLFSEYLYEDISFYRLFVSMFIALATMLMVRYFVFTDLE